MKSLKRLKISDNEITDISVIQDMEKLNDLDISANKIKDISDLQDKKYISYLNISNNDIEDIIENVDSLRFMFELEELKANNNKIDHIKALKKLDLNTIDISSIEKNVNLNTTYKRRVQHG